MNYRQQALRRISYPRCGVVDNMAQSTAERRHSTRRAELGHHVPRRFTKRSRHRFDVTRRRAYLGRIAGPPTPWQSATIDGLIALEWSALEGEHRLGDAVAARDAREHRRLFQRLLSDFERSLTAPPPRPPRTLQEAAAQIAARRAP
jgi:hypothetical protein